MADALVECCCRLCLELICHVGCAVAYGICGVNPRKEVDLHDNELELYIGKPPPSRSDWALLWFCAKTRVFQHVTADKRAKARGMNIKSLEDLSLALDRAYQKGGIIGGLIPFIESEIGQQWAMNLDITLSVVNDPPVAVRVQLGQRYRTVPTEPSDTTTTESLVQSSAGVVVSSPLRAFQHQGLIVQQSSIASQSPRAETTPLMAQDQHTAMSMKDYSPVTKEPIGLPEPQAQVPMAPLVLSDSFVKPPPYRHGQSPAPAYAPAPFLAAPGQQTMAPAAIAVHALLPPRGE